MTSNEMALMANIAVDMQKNEVNAVLDKISAEIEKEYNKYRNMSEKWDERACGIGTALEIIDKYRESEVRNDK